MKRMVAIFICVVLSFSYSQASDQSENRMFTFSSGSNDDIDDFEKEMQTFVNSNGDDPLQKEIEGIYKKNCLDDVFNSFKKLLDDKLKNDPNIWFENRLFITSMNIFFLNGETVKNALLEKCLKHLTMLLDTKNEPLSPMIFLEFMEDKKYQEGYFLKVKKIVFFLKSLRSLAKRKKKRRVFDFFNVLIFNLSKTLETMFRKDEYLRRRVLVLFE